MECFVEEKRYLKMEISNFKIECGEGNGRMENIKDFKRKIGKYFVK